MGSLLRDGLTDSVDAIGVEGGVREAEGDGVVDDTTSKGGNAADAAGQTDVAGAASHDGFKVLHVRARIHIRDDDIVGIVHGFDAANELFPLGIAFAPFADRNTGTANDAGAILARVVAAAIDDATAGAAIEEDDVGCVAVGFSDVRHARLNPFIGRDRALGGGNTPHGQGRSEGE